MPPTDNTGVTGYEVFRNGTSIGTPTATTFNVTGLAANTSYSMTVRAKDAANNYSAQSSALSVTTNAVANVPVTGVSLSPTSASVNVGSSTTLTATVAPSNATNKTVTWSSNNTSKATVNASGVVSGVAAGSATITATTQDGNKTATCTITINSSGGGSTAVPLGAGLDGINDYSSSRWFVDVMKHARVFGQADAAYTKYTGTFNTTTYYPNQSFALIVILSVDPTHEAYMFGTYKLSFKGQATVSSSSSAATVTNQVYNSGTDITTADVVFVSGADNNVWLKFTNPVNMNQLRMISPGYSTSNPPLLRTEMVKIVKPFNQLRFMDWLSTNNNPAVNWADRHLPSLPGQINRNKNGVGSSWEDVCQFANELNKEIWINIPMNADNNYITQCATLLKNNLNPNIKVYVEFSNEVWNFGFGQFFDNTNAAVAEVNAGGSTLNNDGTTNQNTWAKRRVVKKIYEISNIFKSVWGASAINTSIRCVVAGQLTYSLGGELDWFNKTYGAPKNFFWAIANAPYWNDKPLDDNNLSATSSQLLTELENSKNELFDNRAMDYAAAIATYYGLEFMGYEGGPDTFGPNNQVAKANLNFDPRMKTISTDFLTRWYQNGGKQYNWFVIGCGGNYITQYGTWNLLGWLQDSTINQKYQAVRQFINGPYQLLLRA